MRRKVLCLFVALTCSLAFPAGKPAEKAKKETREERLAKLKPVSVYKTKSIKIDGKLDDECWKKATAIPVNFRDVRKGKSMESVQDDAQLMTVKYTWDKDHLYIGYEVFDENLQPSTQTEGGTNGPEGNKRKRANLMVGKELVDVVEFFITFTEPRMFWELHHNANNDFNDVWVTVFEKDWPINHTKASTWGHRFCYEEFIKDTEAAKVKMAVSMKPKADGKPSTPNDDSDKDTGYTGEIQLPISELAVPKKAEIFVPSGEKDKWGRDKMKSVGFDLTKTPAKILAVLQNNDLKYRYYHSSPIRRGGWFHGDVDAWNLINFKE